MSQYGAYGYSLHLQDLRLHPRPLLHGHRAGRARRQPRGPGAAAGRPGSRSPSRARSTPATRSSTRPRPTACAAAPAGLEAARRERQERGHRRRARCASTPRRARRCALNGTSVPGVRDGLYRGSLLISASGSGLIAVNALDLEDYVRGVVSGESPSAWPTEALKAQAVAARTYAITTHAGRRASSTSTPTRARRSTAASAAETPSTDAAVRPPPARSSPSAASRSPRTSSRPPAARPRTSRTRSSARSPSRG